MDRVVRRLASAQHEMVARWQLLPLGVSDDVIQHRCDTQKWRRRRPGVYQVGTSRLTRRAQWMIDILSCGPGAGADAVTALQLMGVLPERARRTMVVTQKRGRRPPKDILLRCSPAARFKRWDGIPTIDIPEALATAAPHLNDEQLEAAYDRAVTHFNIAPSCIPKRDRRLNQLIKDHERATALTDSELENLFRRILKASGLPQPRTKLRVGRRIPDFIWPQFGVVAEVNGPHHAEQQEADARRNAELSAEGLIVQTFTKLQLIRHPGDVPQALRPFLGGAR